MVLLAGRPEVTAQPLAPERLPPLLATCTSEGLQERRGAARSEPVGITRSSSTTPLCRNPVHNLYLCQGWRGAWAQGKEAGNGSPQIPKCF